MSGRRAAFGVAFKNARHNKKRTFYMLLMIAVPVMVAVVVSAVVRLSYISPEEAATLDMGQANVLIEQSATAPGMEEWTEDQIATFAPNAERLEYRAEYTSFTADNGGRILDVDLDNPLSEGILDLVSGSAPDSPDEVVLTESAAAALGVGLGESVEFDAFPDESFEVVGLASHPVMWSVDDAVVTPGGLDRLIDEANWGNYLLLRVEDDVEFNQRYQEAWDRDRYDFYPGDRVWPMPVEFEMIGEHYYAVMNDEQLVEAQRILEEEGEEAFYAHINTLFPNGVSVELPYAYASTRTDRVTWNETSVVETGPVIGTAVAAVILAEVALIAGAAFATGTRRRLREIGLMGANGASAKQVRATVIGEGLVVGLLGGLVGSFVAFLLITLGRPVLQQYVARRIEGFPFSPLDVIGPILVAVVACTIAAWVPARTASGVPTLTALQGRMPVGAPKRWIVPVGLVLAGFGALLVTVGLTAGSGSSGVVTVIGVVLMIGGAALLAGPLVAWVSKHAERFPITSRIVLRDSGRQRGRAAAAVAATMVILMVPVGLLITVDQYEAQQAVQGLPLDRPQVVIQGAHDDEGQIVPLDAGMLVAAQAVVPNSKVVSFDAIDVPVVYPAELAATPEQIQRSGGIWADPYRMSVANDDLIAMLGSERLADILAADGMALIGVEDRISEVEVDGQVVSVAEVAVPVQRWAFPRLMVTEEVAASYAQEPRRMQALLEVDESLFQSLNPLHEPTLALWEAGLGLEMSGGSAELSPTAMFVLVFLATMLVVLVVVATITSLSAAEADSDLQTVVAVGATNSIRRKYLGLQSGLHTLFGCLLAVPLTVLLMWSVYTADSVSGGWSRIGYFGYFDSTELFVPWGGIGLLVVTLPLAIGLVTALFVRSARTTPPRRAT